MSKYVLWGSRSNVIHKHIKQIKKFECEGDFDSILNHMHYSLLYYWCRPIWIEGKCWGKTINSAYEYYVCAHIENLS